MVNRRLKRGTGKSKLFRKAEEEHNSGRMNRPRCSWIPFDSEFGHRLKHFTANLDLKLGQVGDAKPIVVRSDIPPNQLGGIASPR